MTRPDQSLVDAFEAAVVTVALTRREFTSADVWRLVPEEMHPEQAAGRAGVCQGAAASLWRMVEGRLVVRAGMTGAGRPTGHTAATTLYRSLVFGRPEAVPDRLPAQFSLFDRPDGEL